MASYPLDPSAIRALDDALWWAEHLLMHGRRHPYGLKPSEPLTGAERRDFETLSRVVHRIFDRDRQNL